MGNTRRLIAYVLVMLLFTSGCASKVNEVMQSWVGKHQSDLIQAWGPPQQTAGDGKDGTILIYSSYVNLGQTPGQVTSYSPGYATYTTPQQQGYQRTRMFYVDKEGYIYSWRWQGY